MVAHILSSVFSRISHIVSHIFIISFCQVIKYRQGMKYIRDVNISK
jgi:hypothetical protein